MRGLIHFYRPPSEAEQNSMCTGTPPGVSFGEYQKYSVSWASNEYGERFGKELTGTAVFDLEQLDLESDRDLDKFEEYGRRVYETMSSDSYRWAESLKGSHRCSRKICLTSIENGRFAYYTRWCVIVQGGIKPRVSEWAGLT